jgi:hypothetical protein
MLIAVDNCAAPITTIRHECRDLELRWVVTVDEAPAAHHTLRITGHEPGRAGFLGAPLPRWSATTAAWAADLRWELDVRPRVLRSTDPFAPGLGVTGTAAALVIVEQGSTPAGARVEHELIVLAVFADHALPRGWRQQEAQPSDRRLTSPSPTWRTEHAAA